MSSIIQIPQSRLANISRSLWTWWLIVTVLWIPLFFLALTSAFNNTTQSVFTNLLFSMITPMVPYKISRVPLMTTESVTAIAIFWTYMFFVNRFLNGKNLRFGARVLLNLLALLLITPVLDFFLFGTPFQSLTPLLQTVGFFP